MNLYIVYIETRTGLCCSAKVVADNAQQARDMATTLLHQQVQDFCKREVNRVGMFVDAKIDVKEITKPVVINLDWNLK